VEGTAGHPPGNRDPLSRTHPLRRPDPGPPPFAPDVKSFYFSFPLSRSRRCRAVPGRRCRRARPEGGEMLALDYMLAVALLTSGPDIGEFPPPGDGLATVRPTLQALAVSWEVLDPREMRY